MSSVFSLGKGVPGSVDGSRDGRWGVSIRPWRDEMEASFCSKAPEVCFCVERTVILVGGVGICRYEVMLVGVYTWQESFV